MASGRIRTIKPSASKEVEQPDDDDAPEAPSHAGHSIGQFAAEIGATTLREAGVNITPKATEQLAKLFDMFTKMAVNAATSEAKTHASPAPSNRVAARSGLTISIATAVGLMLAILIGSAMLWALADRVGRLDAAQRERLATVEARIAEAENRQLELKAAAEAKQRALEAEAMQHETRLSKVEERQAALVVYLVVSVNALLEDRGIAVPKPPPILRIAEAEAEDAFMLQQKDKP